MPWTFETSYFTSPVGLAVAVMVPKSTPLTVSGWLAGVPGVAFACCAAVSYATMSFSVISWATSWMTPLPKSEIVARASYGGWPF